jgi:hypothetical protein
MVWCATDALVAPTWTLIDPVVEFRRAMIAENEKSIDGTSILSLIFQRVM